MGEVTKFAPFPNAEIDEVVAATASLWPELRGQHLFFTGATGFFGRWMLETMLRANQRFKLQLSATILSRDPKAFLIRAPHFAAEENVHWAAGSPTTLTAADFSGQKFSAVIHLATEADSKATLENPSAALEAIAGSTQRALDFARDAGVPRFLFTSSGSVYGRIPAEIDRMPENFSRATDLVQGDAAYEISGEAKRRAEALCVQAAETKGLRTVIARCFAFAGPGLPLDGKFAFGNFLRDALAGRPIVLTGDGTPVRSYLYATDLTIALWTLLLRGAPGRAYNVGSEHAINLRDLAHLIAQEVGAGEIMVQGKSVPGSAVHRYVPSTARIRDELGLQQTIDLPTAIRRHAAWARQAQTF